LHLVLVISQYRQYSTLFYHRSGKFESVNLIVLAITVTK